MNFRTEIDIPRKPSFTLSHGEKIVMLGSCFTDNIGQKLEQAGFDVTYNPMGPLYNPASICTALQLALSAATDRRLIVRQDNDGRWHCLNFAARYLYTTREELFEDLNRELDKLGKKVRECSAIFLTLGTSYVFKAGEDSIVGNCHKFPATCFERYRLKAEEASEWIRKTINLLGKDKKVVFTVSPIRHTADGLHGNQLSKATLLLALDKALDDTEAHYFPAYEIVLDDLRDYRFYADDMKHPSNLAVDYIYEIFMKYYMTPSTIADAQRSSKEYKRSQHRRIIN